MAPSLHLYVGDLIAHMVGFMTGGILAAIYTLWHGLKQKSWPNWMVISTFLIGGYFVSSYQAWEDQVNISTTLKTNFDAGIPTVSGVFFSRDNTLTPPMDTITIIFSKEYVHPYFLVVGKSAFSLDPRMGTIDGGPRNIAPNVVLVEYDSPSIAAGEPVSFDVEHTGHLEITAIFALLQPYQND